MKQKDLWSGREDGKKGDRFFSRVKEISLADLEKSSAKIVFLGFSSDEGVKRNFGRPGAKEGPRRIRESLRSLAVHMNEEVSFIDLGDVVCQENRLEEAQENLAKIVASIRSLGKTPFVFGGGHETAWGHFLGLKEDLKSSSLGVVNFDAHFDLRLCDEKNPASSGTPFYQASKFCEKLEKPFHYAIVGIEDFSNTRALFEKARELETLVIKREDIERQSHEFLRGKLKRFCDEREKIYLSICLDVFSASFAPGVSAANPLGLAPKEFFFFLDEVLKSGKVIAVDLVELSPPFDLDHRTAKLAAFITNEICHKLLS